MVSSRSETRTQREEFEAAKAGLAKEKIFGLDFETREGGIPQTLQIGGVGLSNSTGDWYLDTEGMGALPWVEIRAFLKELVGDPSRTFIAHNLSFEVNCLRAAGIEIKCQMADSMALLHLYDERLPKGLKSAVKHFFNRERLAYKQAEKDRGQLFHHLYFRDYGRNDARDCYDLHTHLEKELFPDEVMERLYGLEIEMAQLAAEMEWNGILVDQDIVDDFEYEYSKEVEAARAHIFELAGRDFNLNAPHEVAQVFIDLGVDLGKYGSKRGTNGHYSTKKEFLEIIPHPVAQAIGTYRKKQKVLDTNVPAMRNVGSDGRVHCSFNPYGTDTGRWASNNPNMQNVPHALRDAFVASPGHVLVGCDLSQIELRVLAHVTGDPLMVSAFREDRDLHQETANALNITRKLGKSSNFSLAYGVGAPRFARSNKIPIPQAKKFANRYFDLYKAVKQYHQTMFRKMTMAGDKAEVTTIFGRKRRLGDIVDEGERGRTAINTSIQSPAADIIKIGMRNLRNRVRRDPEWRVFRFLLQIHDEVIGEVPEDRADDAEKLMLTTLENAVKLSVPIKASFRAAKHWGALK